MIPKYGLVDAAKQHHDSQTQRTRETFHLYNADMNFHHCKKPELTMKHEDHSYLLHHSLLNYQHLHVHCKSHEHSGLSMDKQFNDKINPPGHDSFLRPNHNRDHYGENGFRDDDNIAEAITGNTTTTAATASSGLRSAVNTPGAVGSHDHHDHDRGNDCDYDYDLDTSSIVTDGGTHYTWTNGVYTPASSPHAVADRTRKIVALPGISAAASHGSPNKVTRDQVTLVSAQNILERGSINYFTSPSEHAVPEDVVRQDIPSLVAMLKEGNGTVKEKENAIRSLLFYVHEKEHLLRMYKYGVVAPLLVLAIKGSIYAYENSLRLLMNISNPPEVKLSMYQAGNIVPVLLQILKSCSEKARNYAIGVLCNLSMAPENKVHMYHKSGVMIPLIRIQREKDVSEGAKERIFGVYLNLSMAVENKVHLLIATNILPYAVKCYKSKDSTCEVVENVTGVLYYLTEHCETNIPIVFAAAEIAPLLLLLCVKGNLQSSETCKEYAVGVLWHMATVPSHRAKLFEIGTVSVLVELLKLCNDKIRRNCCGLFYELTNSETPELRPLLVQTPGLCVAFIRMLDKKTSHSFSQVSPVLSYANPSQDDYKEQATRALVHLTDHGETRVLAYSANMMDCLLLTLRNSTEKTIEYTLQVMYNLSIAGANKVPMFEAGVIEPLFDFIAHGTIMAREFSAGVLSNLSRSRDNKLPMVNAGVTAYLMMCAQEGNNSTRHTIQQVAGCFMRLTDEDGLEVPIVKTGAIPSLMSIIRDTENTPLAIEFAMEAMYNICVNSDMRIEVKQCGVSRLEIGWTSEDW